MTAPTPEPARECIWCGATDNLTERAINPARITKTWECEGDACPLPPLDLDALDRLLTAASPGPWSTGEDGLVWAARVMGDPVSGSTEIPDAELIAAARNALPELIRRARDADRLRPVVDAARKVAFPGGVDQMNALLSAVYALGPDAPVLPERVGRAGEPLPPMPESAYPPGATPLEPACPGDPHCRFGHRCAFHRGEHLAQWEGDALDGGDPR